VNLTYPELLLNKSLREVFIVLILFSERRSESQVFIDLFFIFIFFYNLSSFLWSINNLILFTEV